MTKIVVQEQAEGEIPATAGYFHVVLAGDKFFSGSAVWREAAEVRRLVEATTARGLAEADWSLEGMSLDVSTGLFTRGSSVTFRLRFHLRDVQRTRDVLDVLADAKKCQLTHIEWDYSGGSEERTALLRTAVLRAKAKAEAIAVTLGLSVQSIDEVQDRVSTDVGLHVTRAPGGGYGSMQRSRSSSPGAELAGVELAPNQRLTTHATMTVTAS